MLLPALQAPAAETFVEKVSLTDTRTHQAIALMESFAQRTGLTSGQSPRRYLWTDAFAVCNYLGLARSTGERKYAELAMNLIDQVHHDLGRHRPDDPRKGWISGLSEDKGELHPTRGGLRIGKALPERNAEQRFDSQLEWDRDGQYFHYLTKWMHALDQAARATGDHRYKTWTHELAVTAYAAFTYRTSSNTPDRMVWKMSIDLSRALVPSMGKHDPLDGYITALQLASTAATKPRSENDPTLEHEVAGYAHMVEKGEWVTDDPLGIGGLLVDIWRLQQLAQQGMQPMPELIETLLDATITGLSYYTRSGELQQPAQYRLAFRELGLAIGLQAIERLNQQHANKPELQDKLRALMRYTYLRKTIENFWSDPANQTDTWNEHRDINEVMLATSLSPDGFLVLPSHGPPQR
jgi:hypothetical protein